MSRATAALAWIACLITLFVQGLTGRALPASPAEHGAIERFLRAIEKPPVAYYAYRHLQASSAKLNESAWMDAATYYDAASGFHYGVVAQGGSERIVRRVLRRVLEAEKENSTSEEWRKGNLSHANYRFDFGGLAGDGILRVRLTPRRRDSRLVSGSALLAAPSGDLVRVEGRLAKAPSFWIHWVDVSTSYARVGDSMIPVAIESTADVRIAGLSTFSMTYDYKMVDGQAIHMWKPR